MDLNLVVASSSAFLAAAAVITSVVAAWRSGKSKEERQAAAEQQLRSAARMEAQEEEIAVNASREAVRILRGELNEANTADSKHRQTIEKQNERIDKQGRVIRRQSVRIELQHEEIGALRKWVAIVKERLADSGINGIPDVPRAADVIADEIWPEDV